MPDQFALAMRLERRNSLRVQVWCSVPAAKGTKLRNDRMIRAA